MRISYVLFGVFCAAAAYGQTIVEHSAATAGASTAAAGSNGAGKSIGGVFRNLSDTLDKAGTAQGNGGTSATASVTTLSAPSRPTKKPVPASRPIDPSQVTAGLDHDELIARFGDPLIQLSESGGSQLVERLWYRTAESGQVEIKLIGGKVASIRPPARKKPDENPSAAAPSSLAP